MKPPERAGDPDDRVGKPRMSLIEMIRLGAPYVATIAAFIELIKDLLGIIG